MNLIAGIIFVSIVANLTAIVFIFKIKVLKHNIKLITAALAIFTLFYNICLFIEWSGISNKWDTAEDIIGVIVLIWWGFLFYALLQDITEKKLHKSEKMLQSVLDTVPVRVFWKDKNSVFIGCNRPFANDAGFSEPEDIIGKNDYEMVWKENAELYRADDRLVIEGGIPKLHYEEFQITPDHKKRWVRTSKIPLRNTSGNVTGVLGTYEDISEYKKAEAELKMAHQKLLDIIDFLPDATFVIDNKNKVIAWNYALEKMTNTPKENIIGKADFAYSVPFYGHKRPILIDLLNSDDKETEKKYDHIKRVGNAIESETFVPLLYNGKGAYIFGIAAPLFDQNGNTVGAIECVRDITDSKKAEVALRENEEKYRVLFESANDAIVIFQEGKFIDCNSKTLALLGYDSKDDILGRSPLDFSPLKQPDGSNSKEKAFEYINPALNGTPQLFYWKHLKKDGTGVDVEVSANKISIGKKTYLQGVMRDITAQMQIQRERENLLKELAAKNEELESVLYVGSHDLKSPILNIQGFSGILSQLCKHIQLLTEKKTLLEKDKEKLERIVKQEIPEALEFITAGSYKINSLINNLLKVSRISRAEVKLQPLDMNELIAKIQKSMAFKIQQKNVDFTTDKLPSCLADKIQTDQIFTNLIGNALKYLDPKRKGKIHISGRVEKDMCIYCVQDNGLGIKKEYQKNVFELFHRLNPDDGIEGEGVGLTIVTRTVQLQKGTIWLESEPNKGSKFYVALPV